MEAPISVTAAEALIASNIAPWTTEHVPLARAQGRVLRQDLHADRDQPPFDRVMMDGIAFAHGDGLSRFRLAGTQLAGQPAMTLAAPHDCLEVMTGAMLPQGADTVVPVESLRRDGTFLHVVTDTAPERGQFVHRQGSDCRAGDLLVPAGRLLRAPEIAVLATNGVADVQVTRQPGISVISTGDELVDVVAAPQPWQVRRSNDYGIAAALRDAHFDDVSLHHVVDDRERVLSLLTQRLAASDVLVLCGGVSMGQRDLIPAALDTLGVRRIFHRITQRPGKPMWFGVSPEGKPVFALPGNPVSALVCTLRYVIPALRQASGMPPSRVIYVRLAASLRTHASLTCFIPVALTYDEQGRAMAQPVPSATSGDFASLARTDGIIELPPRTDPHPVGHVAPFLSWS